MIEPLPPRGPILPHDAKPLGEFVDRIWRGETDWCTQHGPALVQWSLGRPSYVWRALTADNARVDAGMRLNGTFRYATPEGVLVHGVLDLSPGDVLFARCPTPIALPSDHLAPLFDILVADESMKSDLQNKAVAAALYALLANQDVAHGERQFNFGERSAAGFVAALRNNGEDYLDYAWSPDKISARHYDTVRAHFERLGLRLMNDHGAT